MSKFTSHFALYTTFAVVAFTVVYHYFKLDYDSFVSGAVISMIMSTIYDKIFLTQSLKDKYKN